MEGWNNTEYDYINAYETVYQNDCFPVGFQNDYNDFIPMADIVYVTQTIHVTVDIIKIHLQYIFSEIHTS